MRWQRTDAVADGQPAPRDEAASHARTNRVKCSRTLTHRKGVRPRPRVVVGEPPCVASARAVTSHAPHALRGAASRFVGRTGSWPWSTMRDGGRGTVCVRPCVRDDASVDADRDRQSSSSARRARAAIAARADRCAIASRSASAAARARISAESTASARAIVSRTWVRESLPDPTLARTMVSTSINSRRRLALEGSASASRDSCWVTTRPKSMTSRSNRPTSREGDGNIQTKCRHLPGDAQVERARALRPQVDGRKDPLAVGRGGGKSNGLPSTLGEPVIVCGARARLRQSASLVPHRVAECLAWRVVSATTLWMGRWYVDCDGEARHGKGRASARGTPRARRRR